MSGVFNPVLILIKRKRAVPSLPVVPVKTIPVQVILLAGAAESAFAIYRSLRHPPPRRHPLSPYLPDFLNRHVTTCKPTLANAAAAIFTVTVNAGIALPSPLPPHFSRVQCRRGQRNTGRSRSTRLDQTHLSRRWQSLTGGALTAAIRVYKLVISGIRRTIRRPL